MTGVHGRGRKFKPGSIKSKSKSNLLHENESC